MIQAVSYAQRTNETFCLARNQFETLIDRLHDDATGQMQHDQVEALIKERGPELMRVLLQGHLDLRSEREQRMESIMGADGVERTHCRESCKRNLT